MNLTTIDQIISESVADRRFYTTATIVFAAVALLLTILGLMIIVARAVVERRRELAIRAALGATSAALIQLVLRQALRPVLAGATLGLIGAYLGGNTLAHFLFHVTPREPFVYATIAALITTTAVLASLVPARRVSHTAPASVLRAE
jgi:putative ABC transport system permease protein